MVQLHLQLKHQIQKPQKKTNREQSIMLKLKALFIIGILLLNFNAIAQTETIYFFPLDTDPGWTTEDSSHSLDA